MARTKVNGVLKSKNSSNGANPPSPAKTGKDHRRSINRSPPMKKDVVAHFSEVLSQIQGQLGSLNRAVRNQEERQVEMEYRIDRKRGAEING
jgi:hypothetical protein